MTRKNKEEVRPGYYAIEFSEKEEKEFSDVIESRVSLRSKTLGEQIGVINEQVSTLVERWRQKEGVNSEQQGTTDLGEQSLQYEQKGVDSTGQYSKEENQSAGEYDEGVNQSALVQSTEGSAYNPLSDETHRLQV